MRFSRRHITLLFCWINLSIICCCVVYLSFSQTTQKGSPRILKYEINKVYVGSLKHVIKITNNSPTPVRGELFIPLIKNETARRYVILQNTPLSTVNDSSGNKYFYCDDLRIDRQKTFSLELSYYVVSFNICYLINSSIIGDYDTSSEMYQKYTKPEELIESNHSQIVSLVHNLTENVRDWHEKTSRIYDFVYRHIDYEVQDEERGALWALENAVGDCSEYSYLFVALCRAVGIPARIQAGFAFHRTSETLEDGHMWAEYYLENYGWIPVDVTWRLFDAIGDKHFSSIRSVPEAMAYANYFFDCSGEEKNVKDEQAVSLTPCSTNVFSDSFVKNLVKTVQKTEQAKFAIFLGKVFGTHIIFPSEAKEIEQIFLEVEIQIQNAIDFWDKNPKIAESNTANALENVEQTLQKAWVIIVKAFMIFISILMVLMLIGLFFIRRHQIKQNRKSEQKFHLHDSPIIN